MLNTEEQEIHGRAVTYANQMKSSEAPLLKALTDAHRSKLYRKFERTGIFDYATGVLKIDEPTARRFITVAKKCVDFPQILRAIEAEKFTVSKAARFVSVLNQTNVAKFIEYATTLSYDDLNHKVADENPQKKKRSIHKPTGNGNVRGSYDWSREFADKLQKEAKRLNLDPADIIQKAVDEFIERHNPLEKAERAASRKQNHTKTKTEQPPEELCVSKIPLTKRKSIPAAIKHAVNKRDGLQCTHMLPDNQRCLETKWLHLHHIVHVEDGGTSELSNLTTLCAHHHELRHQTEFDFSKSNQYHTH